MANNVQAFSTVSIKSGKTYFLHSRQQRLRGNRTVTLYYFGSKPGEGVIPAVPDGYEVGENTKTGLPLLKKKKVA